MFGARDVLLGFTFQVRPHLRPIHWHVVLEQVSEGSASQITAGFEFAVAPDLAPVKTPSRDQIDLVRSIDPLNVRQREFRPAELERTFSL